MSKSDATTSRRRRKPSVDSLHRDLIVIDGLQYSNFFRGGHLDTLAFDPDEDLLAQWEAGGLTCVHVTVAVWEDARATLDTISRWYRVFRTFEDRIVSARTGDDIRAAKAAGKTAVVLGFQNASPFEDDLGLVEVFCNLGVRFAQLTYNIQNLVGGSCYEPNDSGLTRFGRFVIGEMNRVGMIVDLSHVGERTSLDAIEYSRHPCTVTHAVPSSCYAHPRNKSDRLLKALAEAGGVFGIATYPSLTGDTPVTLRSWCEMIARTVELIGVAHVAIGTDTALNWTLQDAMTMNMGRWSHEPDYGAHSEDEPGWAPWPAWYRSPACFPNLTAGLLELGFNREEVAAIMGGNWLRLLDQAAGSAERAEE